MSDYTVIADVGRTLVKLLQDEDRMKGLVDKDKIYLSSPAEMEEDGSPRLSLFLYQVTPNAHLRNEEMPPLDATTMQYPSLILDLYYMLTPYARTRENELQILGRVMQIFHDNAILKGSVLQESLAGTSEELRIVPHPVPLEELNRLWNSFPEKPYKLSVCYIVTPVRIDATRRIKVTRVKVMDADYYRVKKASTP
jgi:hypothetical protein